MLNSQYPALFKQAGYFNLKKLNFMSAPNIFKFATKELTHDAFFSWLIKWADVDNAQNDEQMHHLGKKFLSTIIGYSIESLENKRVFVENQLFKCDIIVRIENEALIIIEDKVFTSIGADQQSKYSQHVIAWARDKSIPAVFFIYLKTGSESKRVISQILDFKPKALPSSVSYTAKVITGDDILTFLNANSNNNNLIVVQFTQYLSDLQRKLHSEALETFVGDKFQLSAFQKLTHELQEFFFQQKKEWCNLELLPKYKYSAVSYPAPNRGQKLKNGLIYFEIRQQRGKPSAAVVFGIGDGSLLDQKALSDSIIADGKHHDLIFDGPKKEGAKFPVYTMSVQNAFRPNSDGNLDKDHLKSVMLKLESIVSTIRSRYGA